MDKMAIICVDDEQSMLDSLEIELNQVLEHSYLVETAQDAEEALLLIDELWQEGYAIPIVIADYIMPGMKGDELLRRVHALSAKTLKIMLTGQATLEAMAYVIKYANLYRYIAKPLDSYDFQLTIKEALNSYFQAHKIEQFYANLEHKVIERTHELNEKNAQLELLNKELQGKNEQLIKLNQEKNEFLGIAAHDLKNPLSGVKGLANLLVKNAQRFSPDKLVQYAQMIENSTDQMFALIKNLLDVNKIESGKIELNLEVVDVLFVVNDLLINYEERAQTKKLILHVEHVANNYNAFVDQNALHQILDNLISNAIKYSPIEKNIYIRLHKTDAFVRCEIQDEGQGLNGKDLQKLFGKFARLTPRPTGKEHSTGLGLFIVKKLVEAMRGNVWCESESGRGALFIVEFPAGPPVSSKNEN